MQRGHWDAAWAISDAVLAQRDAADRDNPRRPYHERWVWDGRPFDGQDVLVRCYHGLGDTLQFCRFLPALRRRVRSLTVEAQPALIPLLRALPGPDRWHPFDPARPLPPSACDMEIMELSHALWAPPGPGGYLRADPMPGPRPALGVCWAAGDWDARRSVPWAMLAPLRALPGVRAVPLQRGPPATDWPGADGTDMDVCRTARIIAGLDVVVTVDTMVAHLAGALGIPTHVLLHHDADWRWGAGDACPWYPGVRQHRQDTPGDWAAPMRRLLADLEERFTLPSFSGNPRAV